MSIWTRDKVWFSTDKRTYWEYRPGNNDVRLSINDSIVAVISTTGSVWNGDINTTGDLTVSGAASITGALTVGALTPSGRMTAGAGLSFSYSTGVVTTSTLNLDTVVSLLTATGAAATYTLPSPTSAGIVKILINTEVDTTHHIDFPAGDLINSNSTESYINMGPAHSVVGLISLSSDQWAIMFPSFSTATVVVSTVAS